MLNIRGGVGTINVNKAMRGRPVVMSWPLSTCTLKGLRVYFKRWANDDCSVTYITAWHPNQPWKFLLVVIWRSSNSIQKHSRWTKLKFVYRIALVTHDEALEVALISLKISQWTLYRISSAIRFQTMIIACVFDGASLMVRAPLLSYYVQTGKK